ncbi:plant UBX domain-containing protein 11-like [Bidens hawaiensis]|uniref:plant UBX domain-containing protein 11-like n=1 Tax=Bidens hawaiensis TaxID=980011 RepID=UPI00404B0B8C
MKLLIIVYLKQMERSVSSLAFKGSIIEAITEAKRQKKLFVVYVSGENEDSISLDRSTWSESSVAESISKYCILLHILEGSTDATQFSAIYPQKPAPCITAIGYNGVQLWQNEGVVSAEILASTLEKAWLSLHVQETILTAALASRQTEQTPSVAHEIGSSSTGTNASAYVDKKDLDNDKEKLEESNVKQAVTTTNEPVNQVTPTASESGVDQKPSLNVSQREAKPERSENNVKQPVTTTNELANQVTTSASESGVDRIPSLNVSQREAEPGKSENNVKQPVTNQVIPSASESGVEQKPTLNVSQHEPKPEKFETIETEKVDNSDLDSKISTDIVLNIRLPGGASLQEKFEPTKTLKMVKDYVDEHQESSIGPYDLAIPYPRKVFTDQDLHKTLTELSLLNRQALIVVPHLQGSGTHKGRSSAPAMSAPEGPTGSSNGESYFSLLRRYFSYVNPLAYLGGGGGDAVANSSTSGAPQGNNTGSRRSYLVTSNQSGNTSSTSRSNKPNPSRFGSGSNIHTLKHDEDDAEFKGQNAFWNGNSTEYGGDGDNK